MGRAHSGKRCHTPRARHTGFSHRVGAFSLLGSGPSLCLEPIGLRSLGYHSWRGNPSGEEVRDDPHSDNRGGSNRCGVAPTAAPLRPQAGPGLLIGAPALLLLSITGRVAEVVSWVPSLEVVLSPRSYAARTVTLVAIA